MSDKRKMLLGRAIAFAAEKHVGHTYGDGPYILHPLRVMSQMDTDNERIVAVLHDVLEDTDATGDNLLAIGVPDHLLSQVEILTRDVNITYADYIREVRVQSSTRKIKLADAGDNLSMLAWSGWPPEKIVSMAVKYHKARRILMFEDGSDLSNVRQQGTEMGTRHADNQANES